MECLSIMTKWFFGTTLTCKNHKRFTDRPLNTKEVSRGQDGMLATSEWVTDSVTDLLKNRKQSQKIHWFKHWQRSESLIPVLLPTELLSSQQAPPPPAPYHHKQHLSINSTLTNQKFQSASECVQLQENWVLGTGVGLQNRWVLSNLNHSD